MSLFKPVLVEHKTSLDSVTKVNGQYIIVVDTKEIYVDRLAADGTIERVGVNRGNVFLQSNVPENPAEGDIWLQTEAELVTFLVHGPDFDPPVTFEYEEGMTWKEWVESTYNTISFFTIDSSVVNSVGVPVFNVISEDIIVPGTSYIYDVSGFL